VNFSLLYANQLVNVIAAFAVYTVITVSAGNVCCEVVCAMRNVLLCVQWLLGTECLRCTLLLQAWLLWRLAGMQTLQLVALCPV